MTFGYELADETVGVLVGATFPRRVWVCVVDASVSGFGKPGELTSIVEGDGLEVICPVVIEDGLKAL